MMSQVPILETRRWDEADTPPQDDIPHPTDGGET